MMSRAGRRRQESERALYQAGRKIHNDQDRPLAGTASAGAVSLKRELAGAAIKKALELMGDGCGDVCITDADGRIYNHAGFDQLRSTERA
jgi:hypothetical protein